MGKGEEGLERLKAACEARPDDADVRFNYAKALSARRQFDAAREAYLKVIELKPDHLLAHFELGLMLVTANDFEAAAKEFALVVEGDPTRVTARSNLVHALRAAHRYKDAVDAQRRAVEALPESMELRAQLAWMLATSPDAAVRNGGEASVLAKALCDETSEKNAELLVIHGAALAESGEFDQAAARVEQALELLKPKNGLVTDQKLVNVIDRAQNCLKLFKQKLPFHEAP
jgi:Flp pilus assembly protein TadD